MIVTHDAPLGQIAAFFFFVVAPLALRALRRSVESTQYSSESASGRARRDLQHESIWERVG